MFHGKRARCERGSSAVRICAFRNETTATDGPLRKAANSDQNCGRQVALDLEPDADLCERRCTPSHGLLPQGVRPLQRRARVYPLADRRWPLPGASEIVVPAVSNINSKQNRLVG